MFKDIQRQIEQTASSKTDAKDKTGMLYLVCNYCGLLSKLSADMLFGEKPKIKADNEDTNERLQEMISDNKIYTNSYESSLGNSYRGDSCLKVRHSKRSKYADERDIIIEPQNPQYFFVEHNPINIRQIDRKIIGFKVKIGNDNYLKLEIHEPGKIYNELYLMSGGVVERQVDISVFDEEMEEEIDTGIDDFLVVHIPNWRTDTKFWGYSDYLDIKSLQDECNNRISQIGRILDMHADPKMKGPADYMDKDGNVDISGETYFPYTKEGPEPEYLTWQAKLDSAFKQIDYILKMLFLVTETSPDAFGLDDGNMADSGRALKFRVMRLLSKIARKKRYYDDGLKKAMVIAQKLDNEHNGEDYEIEEPSIDWRDGLPDDEKEKAETAETWNRGEAASIEEKVRYLHPDWSEERVQNEVDRIEEERMTQSAPGVIPTNFGETGEGGEE